MWNYETEILESDCEIIVSLFEQDLFVRRRDPICCFTTTTPLPHGCSHICYQEGRNSTVVSHMGVRSSSSQAIPHCLPSCISKKLDVSRAVET